MCLMKILGEDGEFCNKVIPRPIDEVDLVMIMIPGDDASCTATYTQW